MENLQEEVKKVGLLPVEIKEKHLILLDINLVPSEYRDGTLKENIEKYEKDFAVKVIPYDSSKVNNFVSSSLITYLGRL